MPVYNAPIASLSTLTPQQQENLILMADTDVRSILQSLETITALQVTQAVSIALNTAGITGLKAITVIEKVKQLDRAAFVFAAGFWNINVFHELKNQYPITAIFDASGDVQFIQFVGKDVNNGTVELTQSQYDSNSFPLKIVLHSQVADLPAIQPANGYKRHPGSEFYYRMTNGIVDRSIDGIAGALITDVGSFNEVYMTNSTPDLIAFAYNGFRRIPMAPYSTEWPALLESEFNTLKNATGTIRL